MIEALSWPLVALAALCVAGYLADQWLRVSREVRLASGLEAKVDAALERHREATNAALRDATDQTENLKNQLIAFENRVGRR